MTLHEQVKILTRILQKQFPELTATDAIRIAWQMVDAINE